MLVKEQSKAHNQICCLIFGGRKGSVGLAKQHEVPFMGKLAVSSLTSLAAASLPPLLHFSVLDLIFCFTRVANSASSQFCHN